MDDKQVYYERIILEGNGKLRILDYVLEHKYGENMLDLRCLNSLHAEHDRKIIHKKDLNQAFLIFPKTQKEAVEVVVESDELISFYDAKVCLLVALDMTTMMGKDIHGTFKHFKTFLEKLVSFF